MALFRVDIIKGEGKGRAERVGTTFIRIPRELTKQRNHWAMFFKLADESWMKVDLLSLGYRIIYGAGPEPGPDFYGTDSYYEPTDLNKALNDGANHLTRGRILSALLLAKHQHGAWVGSGDKRFDCQDFAQKMVDALHLKKSGVEKRHNL